MGRPTALKQNKNQVVNDGTEYVSYSNSSVIQTGQSRLVYLCGDVSEDLINSVQQQILELAHISLAPIQLIVSTYGGSVDDGNSLLDVMRVVPAPVHTIGIGKIMSFGSLILASGEKGHRMIGRLTRVMIHSIRGGIEGNVFECENEINEMKRMQEVFVDTLVSNCKMSKKQIQDLMTSKLDKYITPTECIRLGLCDKII